jgi:hypothetical protein
MSTLFQIDALIEQVQALRPDCKPGVRMLAGKPLVYDANLLRSYECRELVRNAECADLHVLSDDKLGELCSASMRRYVDTKHRDTAAGDLAEACMAEQRRRASSELPTLQPITAKVQGLNPEIWGAEVLQAAE